MVDCYKIHIMSDLILSKIRELIADAKADKKKHIVTYDRIPLEVIETLRSEGYSVNRFAQGECLVIGWGLPTGKTSGKMSIPVILDFIQKLAAKNIRNIICHIFTL